MNKFEIFGQIKELFVQLPVDFQVETVKVLSESINSSGRKLLPMNNAVSSSNKQNPKLNNQTRNGSARGRYATVGIQYLTYMKNVGKPVNAKMIAEALGFKLKTVYGQLDRLHRIGKVKRYSVGKYVLPE